MRVFRKEALLLAALALLLTAGLTACGSGAGSQLTEFDTALVGKLLTSGGRVIGLTAVEDTLPQAIDRAYQLAGMVHFENAYCRRDIGARAMKAFKEA